MKGSRLNFKKAYINPKNQIQTSLGWLTDKQLEVLRGIAKLHGISDQHALAMWNALGAFIRKNVIEKSGEKSPLFNKRELIWNWDFSPSSF